MSAQGWAAAVTLPVVWWQVEMVRVDESYWKPEGMAAGGLRVFQASLCRCVAECGINKEGE